MKYKYLYSKFLAVNFEPYRTHAIIPPNGRLFPRTACSTTTGPPIQALCAQPPYRRLGYPTAALRLSHDLARNEASNERVISLVRVCSYKPWLVLEIVAVTKFAVCRLKPFGFLSAGYFFLMLNSLLFHIYSPVFYALEPSIGQFPAALRWLTKCHQCLRHIHPVDKVAGCTL